MSMEYSSKVGNLLVLNDKGHTLGEIADPFKDFDVSGPFDEVKFELVWAEINRQFPGATMLAPMVLTLSR